MILPYAIWIVFFAYLTREIVKDVCDIRANHGIRVTLPMRLQVSGAMRVAGLFAGVSLLGVVILFGSVLQPSLFVVVLGATAICLFAHTTWKLFVQSGQATAPQAIAKTITCGIYCIMASVVIVAIAL